MSWASIGVIIPAYESLPMKNGFVWNLGWSASHYTARKKHKMVKSRDVF